MRADILIDPTFKITKVLIPVVKISTSESPLFKRILYIYYPLQFKRDLAKIQALLDSNSKVNAKTPIYMAKLGLTVKITNLGDQKINGSTLKTFGIVLASF